MMKFLSSLCAALLLSVGFASSTLAATEHGQPGKAAPLGVAKTEPQRGHVRLADAGDFGAGVAVGVIGSLIARGIAEERAREIRDEEWRWRKCDRRFRSFEWDTGMYTTYGGERRLCPYLR